MAQCYAFPGQKEVEALGKGFLFWNSAMPSRVSLAGDGKGRGLGARRPTGHHL